MVCIVHQIKSHEISSDNSKTNLRVLNTRAKHQNISFCDKKPTGLFPKAGIKVL